MYQNIKAVYLDMFSRLKRSFEWLQNCVLRCLSHRNSNSCIIMYSGNDQTRIKQGGLMCDRVILKAGFSFSSYSLLSMVGGGRLKV